MLSTCVLIRKKQGKITQAHRGKETCGGEGNVKTSRERCSHKPRNGISHQKLQGMEPPEESVPC